MLNHPPGKLPKDDACRDGDVERVLGAVLRYLDAAVAMVDNLLMHALHLVTKDDGAAR